MKERVFDVTLRIHYLPDIEVDNFATTEPTDWNWDKIIGDSVPSCTFVSMLNGGEV